MADEWYYSEEGQQRGPVTTAELRQLAASRRLRPTDLVWRDGYSNWIPAAAAEGLFAQPGPTAARPVEGFDVRDEDARARRRRIFDDDDRLPRRRRKRSHHGLLIGLIIGGVGLLVVAGFVVVVVFVLPSTYPSSGSYVADLAPRQEHRRSVYFRRGQTVQIEVHSDNNTRDERTDVDLLVEDSDGNEVASDLSFGADSFVQFTPARSGRYELVLQNLGTLPNRSHVTFRVVAADGFGPGPAPR
jgi:hypothetical protein